jgi:hypothetical protein
MGALEMQSRLGHFDIPTEQWNFKVYERSSNFADVIKPDAINIIDYLEMHTDLYQMGARMREIFEALKEGVAIIAIQKKAGQDIGYGGNFSLEKARLYISLDRGKMKIVKAKNWKDPQYNPNGLQCDFSLAAGCKFFMKSEWRKEIAQ